MESTLQDAVLRLEISTTGIILNSSIESDEGVLAERGEFVFDFLPKNEKPLFFKFLNEIFTQKFSNGKKFQPTFLPLGNWYFSGLYNKQRELIIFISKTKEKSIIALKENLKNSFIDYPTYRKDGKNLTPDLKKPAMLERMSDLNNRLTHLHNMLSRKNFDLEKRNENLSELAQQLNSLNQSLKNENKELQSLTQVISHDLKSPLNIILNAAALAEKRLVNSEANISKELEIIKNTSRKMSGMINSILNFSKLGERDYNISTFTIGEIVEEIKTYIQIPTHFELKVTGFLGEISTGKTLLFHVLINLVYNAIKYNENAKGFVNLDFQDKGDFLQISVKDNGPGIDKEKQKNLFKFKSGERTSGMEGSGVGLVIVRNLVEKFKGYIVVESEEGKGSTFFILWKKNPVLETHSFSQ